MQVTKSSGICYDCRKEFKEGYEICFNRKVFNRVKLCSCCASSLFSLFAGSIVPKSPKNINTRIRKDKH